MFIEGSANICNIGCSFRVQPPIHIPYNSVIGDVPMSMLDTVYNIIDITESRIADVRPNAGVVITDSSTTNMDSRIAHWLHDTFGGNIICLHENSELGKMPDIMWEGEYWEFKTPTTKNAINDRMRKAVQQLNEACRRDHVEEASCGIVVDISERRIELDEAVKEVERVAASRCRPGMNVIIKDNDAFIKWIIKK